MHLIHLTWFTHLVLSFLQTAVKYAYARARIIYTFNFPRKLADAVLTKPPFVSFLQT